MEKVIFDNMISNLFGNSGLIFLIWLIIGIVMFLLLRELMMWYWKIDKNTESLEKISNSLELIVSIMESSIVQKNENSISPKLVENNVISETREEESAIVLNKTA